MLRAHLFGRPRLLLDEIVLPLKGRPKVVPLFAYLLLHRSAAVPRRTVANALWPDASEEEGRVNVRRHLNYLHALLPKPADGKPWILAADGDVRWNPLCDLWLDVAEFERLARQQNRLHDAVELYSGDLLCELDDEWLDGERARLKTLYCDSLRRLVSNLRAARDFVPAIAAVRRLFAEDPWHEETLRTLMSLHYELGDRAGALRAYETFSGALRDELGAEPMRETQSLFAFIVQDSASVHVSITPERPRDANEFEPHALPFVGRARELAALQLRWAAAADGAGSLVTVAGDTGIGKTRLIGEFGVDCETRGGLVFASAATFPETTPYQPFVRLLQLAEPLLRTLAPGSEWSSVFSPLAPLLYGSSPASVKGAAPDRERLRLFDACAVAWEVLGARRPVLLVIDDVQWAGPGTLALLEYLALRAKKSRVLIVGSYRDDDLGFDHQLRELRRRLARNGETAHVALGGLSKPAVAELIAALADSGGDSPLVEFLHQRSEGNPFFLTEILRGLRESAHLHGAEGRWSYDVAPAGEVPPSLRDVLAKRLARLDERTRTLVDVAAVIGRPFSVELLCASTGWHEASVLDTLGTLTDRRIVREQNSPGRFDYAFAHSLLQATAYEAVPEVSRKRRHRRTARVLTQLYATESEEIGAEIGFHWDRGGEPEFAAEHYLAAARRALALYDNRESTNYVQRVLELTQSIRLRFEALLLRERLAAAAGDRESQERTTVELELLAKKLDPDAVFTALERRIDLANVTSRRRRERILLALFRRLERRFPSARRRMRYLTAEARFLRSTNDFAAARAAFTELIGLSDSSGERDLYAEARLAFADTYIYEGRLDEARRELEDLRSAVNDSGNQTALVRTLMAFARAALAQQDYAAMSAFAREAHEVSRAIGDREGEALALHTLANGLVYTFNVAEARSHYARAYELYERLDHRVGLASISVDLGLFHTEIGLLDDALEYYARAREIAREIDFRFVACVERINAGYCLRLQGNFSGGRAAAEEALVLARELGAQHLVAAALGTLGRVECSLGRHDDAILHLREAVESRRTAGATPRFGDNLCALGFAQLSAGDAAAAAETVEEMLRLYRANPKLPPQPTEWLWTAACVERARENDRTADALLRQAYSVMRARAAVIDDPATRAAFLALPFNRRILEEHSALV